MARSIQINHIQEAWGTQHGSQHTDKTHTGCVGYAIWLTEYRLNTYRASGVHNIAHSTQIKHIQGAHYTIWLTVYRQNAHRAPVVHNMAHCVR